MTEIDKPSGAAPVAADVEAPDATVQAPARRRVPVGAWVAGGWLVILILAAITANWLPMWNPSVPDYYSIAALPSPHHWLGTDSLGRDNLARIIFGARTSLLVGLCSVGLGIVVGGTLGLIAGYRGGKVEQVMMIVADTLLAFPGLVLLLAVVAVLGASVFNLVMALAVLAVPTFIRLARANTLVVTQREFVMAAKAYGARPMRILLRDIAPNVILPVAAYGFIMIGIFIVAEGSLSFLGLGVPPPTSSWGSMIAGGRTDLLEHPHIALIPAAVMFCTVLSINYLGERTRSRFDIKEGNL